jgi:hypothetical protein
LQKDTPSYLNTSASSSSLTTNPCSLTHEYAMPVVPERVASVAEPSQFTLFLFPFFFSFSFLFIDTPSAVILECKCQFLIANHQSLLADPRICHACTNAVLERLASVAALPFSFSIYVSFFFSFFFFLYII